jgi:HlyD family secretion protein
MKLSKKTVVTSALGLGFLALLVYAFLPGPVGADLARVQRGPLTVTVNEDGRTRVKQRYVVSTPLDGNLNRIYLRPGDQVRAGVTVIATIEPTDPQLLDPRARAQAEARVQAAEVTRQQTEPLLEHARTAHQFASADYERVKTLFEQNTVSRQNLEDAEQKERLSAEDFKSAQFAVKIAHYELEMARAALLRGSTATNRSDSWDFPIRSPIDGRVFRVFQESATVVRSGAPLIELGDPSDLEIEVDVLSEDAVKIKPGARVYLDQWGGQEPLQARVRLVEPSGFTKISALGVEEQRVWVIADLAEPPEQRPALGDAFRVEARIVVWEGRDVLKLPVSALFRQGSTWAVFRVENGTARLRSVRLGPRNDLEAQVLKGLKENEEVILHPSDNVRDGVRVRPRS